MTVELVSYTETVIITETVLLEIVTIEAVLATQDDRTPLLRGWSEQYRRPITIAELDAINYNLVHFFSIMLSWERQLGQQGLINDADKSLDTRA